MAETLWVVGFHAVLAVLESEQPVDAVWIQKDRHDQRMRSISTATHRRGLRYDMVPRARIEGVADGAAHNGFAVRTAPIGFTPLQDVIRPKTETGRLLMVDDINDPQNLGAVIRTAAAFDIDGLVIAGPSAPPLGGVVFKAAAGLVGRVPLIRERVAADVLATLRPHGYWAFGADADGPSLHSVKGTERWILVVGAEAAGLRAKTRSQVDEFISIPMAEGVESLNLSVSAGILLWELCKSQIG